MLETNSTRSQQDQYGQNIFGPNTNNAWKTVNPYSRSQDFQVALSDFCLLNDLIPEYTTDLLYTDPYHTLRFTGSWMAKNIRAFTAPTRDGCAKAAMEWFEVKFENADQQ